MKTIVLAAALLAAFSMPAFAEDAVKTEDTTNTTLVDPATTSATTTATESEIKKTSARKSGCMHRQTALEMM